MMDRKGIVGILNSSEVPLGEKINYCFAYLGSSPPTPPDAELLLHYSLLLGQQAEMQYQKDKQWPFPVLKRAILSLTKIPETYENYESLVRLYMVQLYCTAADATDEQKPKIVLLRGGLSKAKGKPPLGILLRLMSLPPSEQWPASRIHDSARDIITHYPDSLEADYARITLAMDPAFQEQLSSLTSDYRLQELAAGFQDLSRQPGDFSAYIKARAYLQNLLFSREVNEDPAVKANLNGALEVNLKDARNVSSGGIKKSTDSSLLEIICGMYKEVSEELSKSNRYLNCTSGNPELNDREIVLELFQHLFKKKEYSKIVGPESSLPIPAILHSPEAKPELQSQIPSLRAAYIFSLYKQGQAIPPELVNSDDPLCKLVVDLAKGKQKMRRLRWFSVARKAHFGYDPLNINPDSSDSLIERVQQELR